MANGDHFNNKKYNKFGKAKIVSFLFSEKNMVSFLFSEKNMAPN